MFVGCAVAGHWAVLGLGRGRAKVLGIGLVVVEPGLGDLGVQQTIYTVQYSTRCSPSGFLNLTPDN